ncbi:moesin-like [Xenia sp. Carnegie-2017]|uniref:moesin-like n=1 Tax=Xenia sp. Carnegie-2017 TaxID=2897299 RepID=UPI001F049ED6|nr:moesin-like [Xenia sp. Carnegie-2017]
MPKLMDAIVSTDAKDLRIPISQDTTGRELYYKVVSFIGLKEIWYFGLEYQDTKGFINWLKLNKKVSQQDVRQEEKTLHFRFLIKYYPEDVSEELVQFVTQEVFFSQAKAAILNDVVYCPSDKAVLLASLACQAKRGEYAELSYAERLLNKEKLLPDRIVRQYKLTKDEWDQRITELWVRHGDMMSEDAVMAYLKVVQDLEMYGVTFFEIQNKKGSYLWLGLDGYGLHIYERENRLTPKVGFPWSEVKTLSFNGRKFFIKPLDKKSPDFVFTVYSVEINRQILALCMGNHEMYIRRRQNEPTTITQMKAEAKHQRQIKQEEKLTLKKEREERKKAEELNLQLIEKAKSLEIKAKETAEALEIERQLKQDLEELHKLAEDESAKERQKNQEIEQQKQEIIRQLNEQQVANDSLRQQHLAEQQELEKVKREKEMNEKLYLANTRMGHLNDRRKTPENNYSYSQPPVESHHNAYVPGEFDGEARSAHEVDRLDNPPSPDYDREVSMEGYVKNYLDELTKDLSSVVEDTKLTNLDRIHVENVKAGRNKYNTLKAIRVGNTKQRIDEFECM